MKLKKLVSVLLLASVVAASGLVLLQRQNIYDWYRLRNYQASAPIAQLATDTTMNDAARRVFYVQHPQLEDKTVFRSFCSIYEQTIVLGCYSLDKGIFVLKIDDSRLQGVQQVTAAHEFLHAAYERLSPGEKTKIDRLINSTYQSLNDQRIKKTVEAYRAQDPSVVTNELHSILGTEVRNLPPELETYYGKYFSNRARIVSYSENYEAAFSERKNKVDNYDKQLGQLKTAIDQKKNDLELQGQALQQERARLDSLLQQKRYEEFNAGVDSFNQNVRDYNGEIAQAQSLIGQYNSLLEERNAVALETRELFKALDTRVAPQIQQQ